MKICSIKEVSKEQISNFSCGILELDEYLSFFALQNDSKNIGKTFLILEENKIIGYYTLANASLRYEEIDNKLVKKLPKYPIPCIRIARLAVDYKFQGKKYGALLLKDAFTRILSISSQTGICFVIVDSKKLAIDFYKHYGFVRLNDLSNTLLLSIKTLEKAYIKK